jgi:peptidoglycan/LPS O-acetylase OafA/YrhL
MTRVTALQAAFWLMAAEAASLAIASAAHLLKGHPASGVPEAVICAVLIAGSIALRRKPERWRRAAQGAVVFAIAGFLVGLAFTLTGSSWFDVAYHATVLPLLIVTLALLRVGSQSGDDAAESRSTTRPPGDALERT